METVLIVTLGTLCMVLPFWLGARFGLVPLVSPMHLLSYFCAFGFVIKVVVYGFVPEFAFFQRYIDTPGALLTGVVYLASFILLMCLGYLCAVRSDQMRPGIAEARHIAAGIERQGWLFASAFGVAAVTIVLLLDARGLSLLSRDILAQVNADKQIKVNASGVGATLAGIKTFFIVPKCAFVLLLAQGIVLQERRILAQAAILAGLLVLIALMSGDRFELVELLVFGLAVYLILGGRIGVRIGVLALAAAVTLFLLVSYMTVLRGGDRGLWAQMVGSTYFLDINAAVMVTDRVTPAMYLWGESYGWWSFGWIPRAIWVDKPAIDLGVFLKRDVMGVTTGGAFNVTGPGEAFINFGWAGAGVGFILGWLYRKGEVAVLCAHNSLRYGAFLLYPLIFYPFVQATLQSSFSAFVVGAAAQLVLIWAMIVIFVPRYRIRRYGPAMKGVPHHV